MNGHLFPGSPWIAVMVSVPALVSLCYPVHLAVTRFRRPRHERGPAPPRIGIVVPLRGSEEGLRANAAALMAQRAPGGIELVFVAEDAQDAGLAMARSLSAGSEHVRIVVSGPARGDLGKGHNLAAGLEHIDADVVVLVDSDARPPDPGFLARLVEPLSDRQVGVVTCVPSYRGAGNLGAGLVAAMIDTDVAGLFGMLAAWNRMTVANGTCVAVRADVLKRAGGVSWLRRRLLMDSALARRAVEQGYRVALHREPVPVHRSRMSLSECWSQAHRWHVAMRFGLPLSRYLGLGWLRAGVPIAAAAFALAPHASTAVLFCWAGAARILAALLVSRLYLHDRASPGVLLLTPAADVCATLAWFAAFLRPEVNWRGARYRVGPGAIVSPRSAP
jgi:ceramide glucosyltransferase